MKFRSWLNSWLTMKRVEHLFTDCVSGKGVWLYRDCYGQEWMADSRFGFRVRRRT